MRCTARNQQALRAGQSAARSCELFAGLFVLTLHGSVVLMFSSRFAQTSMVHTPDCLLSDRDGLGLRHNSIGASQNSSHALINERLVELGMRTLATRSTIPALQNLIRILREAKANHFDPGPLTMTFEDAPGTMDDTLLRNPTG